MLEKRKDPSNLSSHLKYPENEEQNKSKARRRKQMIKISTEINELTMENDRENQKAGFLKILRKL